LLALLNRERTGKGCLVEVSLIETAISSLVNQACNWLVANKLPTRQGSAHPNIAPYGESFETADGKRVLLAIGSDRQFQDLCAILQLAAASQFATNQQRVQNRLELAEILAPAFKVWNARELMAQIHQKKIPAGIIQNIQEALEMPGLDDVFLISPKIKGIRSFVAKFPTQTSPERKQNLLPPPHFGEHTDEVLHALGLK
jgi:crotonobetainyl-CoA:carnitine CoA-transferase CaiB-like acyl-CoA transferase